jgi:hypothetical protein
MVVDVAERLLGNRRTFDEEADVEFVGHADAAASARFATHA